MTDKKQTLEQIKIAPELFIFEILEHLNKSPQKTLRDEFAMSAMQGFIISGKDMRHASEPNEYASDTVARLAYKYADAMLKQREVKND